MSVDCSMMIRCDFRADGDHSRKVKYMHDFIDRLRKECRIPFADYSLEQVHDDICCFDFRPLDMVYVNLYDGFWECESGWRFTQYIKGGIRRFFFDVAQYFGGNDVYICDEFCGWNGGVQDNDTFEEWLADKVAKHGNIPEYDPDVTPTLPYEELSSVYHDKFEDLHAEKARISAIARSYGMEETGIDNYYDRFYVFLKDGKNYLYDDVSSKLFSKRPISWLEIEEWGTFDVMINGVEKRYGSDGKLIK